MGGSRRRGRWIPLLIELRAHPKEFNCIFTSVDLYEKAIEPSKTQDYLQACGGDDGWFSCKPPFLNLWQQVNHGRFANEVFHHFFATLLCEHHGLTLRTAPWAGQSLFGITDEQLERKAPVIVEHDPRPEKSALWRTLDSKMVHGRILGCETPVANTCIFGNFQFNTGLYSDGQRKLFQSLYHPTEALESALRAALAKMMGANKTLVAIHLRREDYKEGDPGMFYRTPAESYKKWLAEIWPLLDSPMLYIASDDPNAYTEFKDFLPYTAKDMAVPIGEQFYVDFWVLSQAHALAISNSSFSFAAAMLNEQPGPRATLEPVTQESGPQPVLQRMAAWMVRPLRDGSLVEFSPWDSEVLLGRYDAPQWGSSEDQCHAMLAQLLPQIDPKREGAVIEVGCGTFGWAFDTLARLGYRCHAVEPMPTKELEQACMTTGTTLTRTVMSDTDGFKTFYTGRDRNLWSTVKDWWGLDGKNVANESQSVRLETFLARANVKRISCLKLDVEGAEIEIVRQIPGHNDHILPSVVMLEFGGASQKERQGGWTREAVMNTIQCLTLLEGAGYNRVYVVESGFEPKEMQTRLAALALSALYEAPAIVETVFNGADYGNFIAVRETPMSTESFTDGSVSLEGVT